MPIQQSVPLIYKSATQIGLRSTAVTSFIGNTTGLTLIGGTSTTADLTLQTTSGAGTTGADMHFLVGNNGAKEAMTILNSGNVGINDTTPDAQLDIQSSVSTNIGLIVQGAASQSADLQQWLDSSGTVLGSILPKGNISTTIADTNFDGTSFVGAGVTTNITRTTAINQALDFIIGGYFVATLNATVTSGDTYLRGMQGSAWVETSTVGTVKELSGMVFHTYNKATAGQTITGSYGIQTGFNHRGAGNVTTHYGIAHTGYNSSGTGTIATAYGIYVNQTANQSYITNHYGIYIANTVGNTLAYSIYTNAGIVRFGDEVRIEADSKSLVFGAGQDATISYDGTNLVINPKLVGTGVLSVTGDVSPVNVDASGVYKVDSVQVVSNRVIDARIDDTPNSGDATTDGIIAAIQSILQTHGLAAAA